MLDRAAEVFAEASVDHHERIDVPGRGTEASETQLREPVQAIVPALQSGSLFGGSNGVIIVDAQNLQKSEAEVIAELVALADADAVTAVVLSVGSMLAPRATLLEGHGETASCK